MILELPFVDQIIETRPPGRGQRKANFIELIRNLRRLGYSFAEMSNRIERLLARRENRPIRDGIWKKRFWNKDRCRNGYVECERLWPDEDGSIEREARREGRMFLLGYAD